MTDEELIAEIRARADALARLIAEADGRRITVRVNFWPVPGANYVEAEVRAMREL